MIDRSYEIFRRGRLEVCIGPFTPKAYKCAWMLEHLIAVERLGQHSYYQVFPFTIIVRVK